MITEIHKGHYAVVGGIGLDKKEVEQLISELTEVLEILKLPRPV